MRVSLLLALLVAGADSAACPGERHASDNYGANSHFVSAVELIGRPEFFDGQPVSAIGVVQFRDDKDQPIFRLYATSEDLHNMTPAAVSIGSFSSSFTVSDEDMSSLNGKTVKICGIFQIHVRPKMKTGKKNEYYCLADCGVPGEIANISEISRWP